VPNTVPSQSKVASYEYSPSSLSDVAMQYGTAVSRSSVDVLERAAAGVQQQPWPVGHMCQQGLWDTAYFYGKVYFSSPNFHVKTTFLNFLNRIFYLHRTVSKAVCYSGFATVLVVLSFFNYFD